MRRGEEVTGVMEIVRHGVDVEVRLTGTYYEGTPDVHYLPNGDPGYPGDPAEIDDIKARTLNGDEIELTEEELETAHEILMDTFL